MSNYRCKLAGLTSLLAVATLVLSACGGGSDLRKPKEITELKHPAYEMKVEWKANGGAGTGKSDSNFVPAVAGDFVYVANHDGEVVAFRLSNGDKAWSRRLDDDLMAGPTVVDDKLLVASREGKIMALSVDDGKEEWHTRLSSEVVSRPVGDGDYVLARTVDGNTAAMEMDTGRRLWTLDSSVPNLTMRGTAVPIIADGVVYLGLDNGKLQAVDLETGEKHWEQRVAIPSGRSELDRIVDVDADPLLDGDQLYAISAGQSLMAMDRQSGQIDWQEKYSSSRNMALDETNIYLTDLDDIVYGIARADGEESWKQDDLKYRKLSAPAVVGDHVAVGDFEGYVHWLSANDGSIEGRGQPFGSAIQAQPVALGDDRAVVLSTDGELAVVRLTSRGS